jgi:glycerophosphoryl diester phosphodiesterase
LLAGSVSAIRDDSYIKLDNLILVMPKSAIYNVTVAILLLFVSLPSEGQNSDKGCISRPPHNGVYVIAHRGAHTGIPENSLPAYEKAIELGCDFVEIDVRTTSDGKFVSMHDTNLDSYVKGVRGKVHDYTLKKLQSFDIGKRIGPQWKGTKIPELEEILKLCKGKIGIYLDLKKAHVADLAGIIKKHGMEKEVVWYIPATDTKKITSLKSNCPECLLMPDPGAGSNIAAISDTLKNCIFATDMEHLDESFVKTSHEHKSLVFCDDKSADEAEWTKIAGWKTDGIQTDKPEELIRFLKKTHK